MRDAPVRFEKVTKAFGRRDALQSVSLNIAPARIVGLVGTNGSGKTTLLRHIPGIYLPTQGECFTLGKPARKLGAADLARIGMVHQHEEFLSWMNVRELISYVGSFYPTWDTDLQDRLVRDFELDPQTKAKSLSPGNRQRLSLILATCHRPELLLLDEPLSDLDPLARERILKMILDVFRDHQPTIIISSHLLHDIERIINHVCLLDGGRLILDEPLDNLHERFAEWSVVSINGGLPTHFSEPWIVSQSGDARSRVLIVSDSSRHVEAFRQRYGASVEPRSLNLERIFNAVVGPLH
jgi:ABC-2 type transport system ATP-binding protein